MVAPPPRRTVADVGGVQAFLRNRQKRSLVDASQSSSSDSVDAYLPSSNLSPVSGTDHDLGIQNMPCASMCKITPSERVR